MALIGGAHSISHFFQLAVPVLFPLIKDELNVGYAELGLLATLFYAASGLCQSGSGFVVDYLGARRLLFAGIGVLCGSNSTLAPQAFIFSTLAGDTPEGTKIAAGTSAECAVRATASPWLPPDAVTMPAAICSFGVPSRRFIAPRALKDPVTCIHSSFSETRA